MNFIKTYDQFAAIIKPYILEREGTAVGPAELEETILRLSCRFCGWIDAASYADANMRELINLFTDGSKGYKTKEDVVGQLGTLGEDSYDDAVEDTGIYPTEEKVQELVKEFFGK